jgi:hypothetical protein
MKLVVDCGSLQLKAGLFEGDTLIQARTFQRIEDLTPFIANRKIDQALACGDTKELLATLNIPCQSVAVADFDRLGTDQTRPLLQPDKIANIFGALYHFPLNDCVVVDLGSILRFDYITKTGLCLGGAVFPLSEKVKPTGRPAEMLLTQEQSGIYYGLLGIVERVVAELRLTSDTPSGVMVVVTGGWTLSESFAHDLQDFTDCIDPHLTLMGLNQIIKERS